ncbi:hypothetical protein ACFSOZ_23255 [Mesorhizobium newzealandense]|uniref:RepB-like DNA primase domain-containing protein n=1 Tax=Mesorhizobium newzealandense TaxID=1300302 RepID=A0ABW4UGF3_9HYPH
MRTVVLLAEGIDRAVTLRDLEGQYHRMIQTEPALADHLQTRASGMRYSGSCRSVTNRISASQAALLSALATRGITAALKDEQASVRIWSVSDAGEVQLHEQAAAPVTRIPLAGWTVTYDQRVQQVLVALRARNLPNETGGVLLGISDASRRSIHIVRALPKPADSEGRVERFERCRYRINTPQKCRLNLPQFSVAVGPPGRAPEDRRRVITDTALDGREGNVGDQTRGDSHDFRFAPAGIVGVGDRQTDQRRSKDNS